MSAPAVRATSVGDARVVSIDHAPTRNSLAVEDLYRLTEALLAPGPHDWVLLRSATPGSFCSGFRLDTAGRAALASGEAAAGHEAVMAALAATTVPVVAAVDGPAVGLGCELALRCDVRFGTARASFAIPAARLGLHYPADSVAALAAMVGRGAATALLVAGSRIDPDRALAWGLLHEMPVLPRSDESDPDALARHVHAVMDSLHAGSTASALRTLRRLEVTA